jgi:hypothetical protein
MIRDAAMSHTDLRLPNLKKPMKPSDTALCKITAMPNPTAPDRLAQLLSFLLTFHGTTGRAKHLQTFTKLSKVHILIVTVDSESSVVKVVQASFHTFLRRGK